MIRSFFTLLTLTTLVGLSVAHAQTPAPMSPPIKKIEVTGTAEEEVVPDELYFTISLKEYFKDEKAQKDKVTIDVLERQLIAAVAKAGLPKEDLRIGGISGYRNVWPKPKKPAQFLEGKQYVLKLANLNKVDGVLADVDARGIENVYLSRTEYSKREQLKRDVKIKALKAAQEKAQYLAAAVNEQVTDVLEIREVEEGYYAPQPMMMKASAMRMEADAAGVPDSELEFQKIKVTYRMQAVFRLK
jgi:uncharacterized protein YggE